MPYVGPLFMPKVFSKVLIIFFKVLVPFLKLMSLNGVMLFVAYNYPCSIIFTFYYAGSELVIGRRELEQTQGLELITRHKYTGIEITPVECRYANILTMYFFKFLRFLLCLSI